MDFPLSNLYCVHHLPKGNTLCGKYEPFSVARHNVHCAFRITDTIAYNAIKTNDFSDYNQYLELAGQKDHTEKNFKELISDFDISKMPPIEITYYAKMELWVVSNGLHRLTILKHKGLLTDRIPSNYYRIAYLHFNKKYLDSEISAVEKALLSTTSDTLYNGWNNKRAPFGYHTYSFAGKTFAGQRNNLLRIADMKKHVDFLGKSVLDFGCNTGGLLHHLPEIAKGCGTDIDEKCMIAARTLQTVFRFQKKSNVRSGES